MAIVNGLLRGGLLAPHACLRAAGLALAVLLAAALSAQAGKIGHFNPGLPNIRDFFVPPEPGFCGIVYNYFCTTGRLNDRNGDEIKSVTINPGREPQEPMSARPSLHQSKHLIPKDGALAKIGPPGRCSRAGAPPKAASR